MIPDDLVTVSRHDLATLIDYSYAEEEASYVECGCPEKGHIFVHIERLQNALTAYLREGK